MKRLNNEQLRYILERYFNASRFHKVSIYKELYHEPTYLNEIHEFKGGEAGYSYDQVLYVGVKFTKLIYDHDKKVDSAMSMSVLKGGEQYISNKLLGTKQATKVLSRKCDADISSYSAIVKMVADFNYVSQLNEETEITIQQVIIGESNE